MEEQKSQLLLLFFIKGSFWTRIADFRQCGHGGFRSNPSSDFFVEVADIFNVVNELIPVFAKISQRFLTVQAARLTLRALTSVSKLSCLLFTFTAGQIAAADLQPYK